MRLTKNIPHEVIITLLRTGVVFLPATGKKDRVHFLGHLKKAGFFAVEEVYSVLKTRSFVLAKGIQRVLRTINMSSIFDNVLSQFIDSNGKTRVLNYENVSLATSPLPPMDVRGVSVGSTIFAEIETVQRFVRSHDLKIVEQDGNVNEQLIQGVWVQSTSVPAPIAFGYIPIEIPDRGTNALDKIPFSQHTTTDPLFVGETSHLDDMRHNEKVAEYLKQYSLYVWAQSPDTFGMDNFYIDKDHDYDLARVNHRIDDNDVLFHHGKLIVPDRDTAERLITYVKVSALNDSTLLLRAKNKKVVDGSTFYTSIDDFRREKKQLVFIGRDAVLQWKMEHSRNLANTNVFAYSRPRNKEPYYYRNLNIENGRLMIIQNTQDADFPSALAVSRTWELRAINIGYQPAEDTPAAVPETGIAFEVYTEEGKTHESSIVSNTPEGRINPILRVFGYDDGSYAAVLFL